MSKKQRPKAKTSKIGHSNIPCGRTPKHFCLSIEDAKITNTSSIVFMGFKDNEMENDVQPMKTKPALDCGIKLTQKSVKIIKVGRTPKSSISFLGETSDLDTFQRHMITYFDNDVLLGDQ